MTRQLRGILARHEPLLSRALSDALLSAWVAGTGEVVKAVPDLRPARAGGGSPDVPHRPIAGSGAEGDPPPVVRFPLIEAAARDLFERKVTTKEEFDQLADDAQRAAFTVSRVGTLDALRKIQEALVADVAEGGTLRSFEERIDEALGASALNPAHLENVYRTNLATAYTTGLLEVLRDPLVADEFPYLRYVAVHDARARKEHLAMETLGIDGGPIYRRDDPIWEVYTPPWGHNCRCHIVPLTLEDAARAGIREAQEWLKTGVPPARPAWVKRPPFGPPADWTKRKIEAFV